MEAKSFQLILYVVFGVFILVGFGSLAAYGFLQKKTGEDQSTRTQTADILVWGTIDIREIAPIARRLSSFSDRLYGNVRYVEKNPDTIQDEYIEAIAVGRQPDLLLIDHHAIFALEDTLQTVPFSYFPLAQYEQTFIQPANLFIRPNDGYVAIPFFSDAMVLYYNENMRLRNGIRALPTEWSQLSVGSFLKINERYRDTSQALVPLGAYGNYRHAADLFAALILQVQESDIGLTERSARDILRFYASFAHPRSSVYTWSVAHADARDMFTGGNLFLYPGYISEFHELQRANPNIPVRVAPLPQFDRNGIAVTPSTLYAFAVPKRSRAPEAALAVLLDMLGVLYDKDNDISELFSLPPAVKWYYPDNESTATERVFIDSLFSSRSVYLTSEERETLLRTLQGVVVGTQTAETGAQTVLSLFR